MAPCDDRPIAQNGGKSHITGLDLLHVLQLFLDGAAVTTRISTAPCEDRPILQDGGKSIPRGLDLLHVLQLVVHGTAITTTGPTAPCHDRPITQDGAKASREAWICCTFFSWCCTELLSPPPVALPHVTTDPSPGIAAKHWRPPRMRTVSTCSVKQSPVCNLAAPSCVSPSKTLPDELKSRPRPTPRALRARSAKLCTEAVRSASSDTLLPLIKVTSMTVAMAIRLNAGSLDPRQAICVYHRETPHYVALRALHRHGGNPVKGKCVELHAHTAIGSSELVEVSGRCLLAADSPRNISDAVKNCLPVMLHRMSMRSFDHNYPRGSVLKAAVSFNPI